MFPPNLLKGMLIVSKDSALLSVNNRHTRWNIVGAFVIGYILGYVSFIIGAIFALEGTRALIHVVLHRSAWLHFLREEVPRLFRKTKHGRITDWKIQNDNLTGEPNQCMISYEYRVNTRANEGHSAQREIERTIDSQDQKYSLPVILHLLKEIEEETKEVHKYEDEKASSGFLYLARDPAIGFPLHVIENKRQEMIFWAQYVDIGIAFFGLHIYVLAAFLYTNLTAESSQDVWQFMIQSILSPVLMTPYLMVESRIKFHRRVQAWKDDPIIVASEFETMWKCWQWMGSTTLRKFYTVSFFLGTSIIFLSCGVMVLLCALVMIYCLVHWTNSDTPIARDTLQTFHRQSYTVTATIIKLWLQSSKYSVTIRYLAPSGEYVIKDVQSRLLYDHSMQNHRTSNNNDDDDTSKIPTVEVLVHPDHPKSGYPTLQFMWDLHHSWKLLYWHIATFLTMWVYLVSSSVMLDVDLDYAPEELAVSILIILWCPLLMLPHATVLRRKEHRRYFAGVYERGTLVDGDVRDATNSAIDESESIVDDGNDDLYSSYSSVDDYEEDYGDDNSTQSW